MHTCACHFLQQPPAPLNVGTPLSALTPAPVMMTIFLASEKVFLNFARSAQKHKMKIVDDHILVSLQCHHSVCAVMRAEATKYFMHCRTVLLILAIAMSCCPDLASCDLCLYCNIFTIGAMFLPNVAGDHTVYLQHLYCDSFCMTCFQAAKPLI